MEVGVQLRHQSPQQMVVHIAPTLCAAIETAPTGLCNQYDVVTGVWVRLADWVACTMQADIGQQYGSAALSIAYAHVHALLLHPQDPLSLVSVAPVEGSNNTETGSKEHYISNSH
jgi:hypothetical protein